MAQSQIIILLRQETKDQEIENKRLRNIEDVVVLTSNN